MEKRGLGFVLCPWIGWFQRQPTILTQPPLRLRFIALSTIVKRVHNHRVFALSKIHFLFLFTESAKVTAGNIQPFHLDSTRQPSKMTTLGCVFCEKHGNVSALNQHIRSYLDASRTGRHTRGSEHHNMEIVQAFYTLTAKRQAEFISATSTDRLAVLTEFASNITKHLTSDAETEQWRKRDFYPRRATWWARQITVVLDMYRASGRLPQLLAAHVKNIIDKSIAESLLNIDDDDDDDHPALPKKVQATRAQLLAMGGTSRAFMPAPQTDQTMQYTGSQSGNRHAMDSSIMNKPTRRWTNNLSPSDTATAEPKLHVRKRQNTPFNYAREARSTEYVTISDEDQDELDPEDRRPVSKTARAVSSSLSSTRLIARPATRSASDSAAIALPELHSSAPDGFRPWLTLHVTGLSNTVQEIPIPKWTTLDEALDLAVGFAPRVVRESKLPVRFYGDLGTEWEGDWPGWRWDQIMAVAQTQKVVVALRLVLVE